MDQVVDRTWGFDVELGVKKLIFENGKEVVKLDWKSILTGFVMLILTKLISKLARNSLNGQKQQKSIHIFRTSPALASRQPEREEV